LPERKDDPVREEENSREAPGQPEDTQADGTGTEGLMEELQKLMEENRDLFQQVLRKQADFENYRKRVARERAAWREDLLGDFIKKMLPLLDNLERALTSSVKEEEKGLKKGLEMVYQQFLALLKEEGVEEIVCRGEAFDPHIHEAVMVVDSEAGENTVVDELQKGYRLGDRILRCSMVTVSK
jgi:molecular chaperone GrpE